MTFGQDLGSAAHRVAQKMGNVKSLGKCALAVGDSLSIVLGEQIASKFRGNAYQWISKVESDLGKKYWSFLKQSKDTTKLPAGSLVIWDRQQAHPYGHIEIADGKGNLCSDFIRSDKLAIYKSNPANIIPKIYVPKECSVGAKSPELPMDVILLVDMLYIRNKPSTKGEIIGSYTKGDIITVWAIETCDNSVWGKNSKGYFCLSLGTKNYVAKI